MQASVHGCFCFRWRSVISFNTKITIVSLFSSKHIGIQLIHERLSIPVPICFQEESKGLKSQPCTFETLSITGHSLFQGIFRAGKNDKKSWFAFLLVSKVCRSTLRPFEVLFSQWVCGFVPYQRRYGFPHLLDKNKVIRSKISSLVSGCLSKCRH